ncbi:MAG: GntR family transcriptional regulator [Desulfobulbaceae bacterium]|nr:GntR family transcriptional regulator [Desulfobulbaceae bacterium]
MANSMNNYSTTQGLKKDSKKKIRESEKVYETLLKDILEMNVMPGHALDETTLAKRFNVSRSPIREALIRLSEGGYIQSENNRNSIVTPFDMTQLPKYIEALCLMQRVTSRLAAFHRTNQDIAVIEKSYNEHIKAYYECNIKEMIELNKQFHSNISIASKNPYFHKLYTNLLDNTYRYLRFHFYSYNDELPKEYIDDHEILLKAIITQDVEAADNIAKDHAMKVWQQFTIYLQQNPSFEIDISKGF